MSVTADTTMMNTVRARVDALGRVVIVGFLTGATIGGVGGRLAMLVLRLTSDPGLHGLETDDGFTIGIVSGATLFLVGLTTMLGAFGAVAYLVVRGWLPDRARPWIVGVLAGVIGGAGAIRPGGIDFTRLEPLGLAVAMFVALPAAYGFAMSRLVDRSLARRSGRPRAGTWITLGLFLFLLAVVGEVGILACAGMLLALVWSPPPATVSLWRSAAARWAGRTAILAAAVWWSAELASDVAEVL
jgi:hypothetical protein